MEANTFINNEEIKNFWKAVYHKRVVPEKVEEVSMGDFRMVIDDMLINNDFNAVVDIFCKNYTITRGNINAMAHRLKLIRLNIPKKRWSKNMWLPFLKELCKQCLKHTYEELIVNDRHLEIKTERQILQWYLRNVSGLSLSVIGDITGGKDHATILSSKKRIWDRIETETSMRDDILEILKYTNDRELLSIVKNYKLKCR